MDELFYYGLRRVEDLIEDKIGDKDETTKEKIRENLRIISVAYEKQRDATEKARGFEKFMIKKCEALKKQLKKQ